MLYELWITPQVSVDSGKGRKGNKQCWTAKPPRLPNVAERMQHQQNRRQKSEMSSCFSCRRQKEASVTGKRQRWGNCESETFRSNERYNKKKVPSVITVGGEGRRSCWLHVGGQTFSSFLFMKFMVWTELLSVTGPQHKRQRGKNRNPI